MHFSFFQIYTTLGRRDGSKSWLNQWSGGVSDQRLVHRFRVKLTHSSQLGSNPKIPPKVRPFQIYFSVVPVRSSWDENNGDNNGVGGMMMMRRRRRRRILWAQDLITMILEYSWIPAACWSRNSYYFWWNVAIIMYRIGSCGHHSVRRERHFPSRKTVVF